ncbi:MAG TPA: hypothetical protein ENN28_04660 [Candidatus Uhrbacteria bacterium]|nr:hypothetical protein [Candidatus Uhrbacteria bacterium]
MDDKKNRLIYIVKDDLTANKIQGDDALVYQEVISEALKLLQKHDPKKFNLFTKIKRQKVRLILRTVTAEEFKKIKKQHEEDQK